MRKSHTYISVSALILVLLSVFAFLYTKTNLHDDSSYFSNVELLSKIKQLDEEWELEILKSRIGMIQDYEPVVEVRARLGRELESLENRLSSGRTDQADIDKEISSLRQTLEEKDSMVDDFKLHNFFLLEAFKSLADSRREAQRNLPVDASFREIHQGMLRLMDTLYLANAAYYQPSAPDTPAALRAQLKQLTLLEAKHAMPSRAKSAIDEFHEQVNTWLNEWVLVNSLLEKIVIAPTDQRLDSISRTLSTEQQRLVIRNQQFRFYLLGFAAILGAFFVYSVLRVVRTHETVRRINGELQSANDHLEQRVEARTHELRNAQGELITAARQAGMAEIATNVLHNVGNVLNSINVSAQLAVDRLQASRIRGLIQAMQMLNQHSDDLGEFLTSDPKGKLLPDYLRQVTQALEQEHRGLEEELATLLKSVDHVKEIIASQQAIAGSSSVRTLVAPQVLVEEALRMGADSLIRHHISVIRNYEPIPDLLLDKGRILQILINLIGNAKQAVQGMSERPPQIHLEIALASEGHLRIAVSDNGHGIAPENLGRIFSHGFTTKKDGHGFGLHAAAIAAREMGGTLKVQSEGANKGAAFVLEVPY